MRNLREQALAAEDTIRNLRDRLRVANGRIGGLETSNTRLHEENKTLGDLLVRCRIRCERAEKQLAATQRRKTWPEA
jgi:chromosome segregation ATPase